MPKQKTNLPKVEILKDPTIDSWISEFKNVGTRYQYKYRLSKFLKDTNVPLEKIKNMDTKELKKLLLKYQADETEKKTKSNGFLNIIMTVRSYLISLDKPLKFRRSQLVQIEADNDSHVFTNGDLKLLFDVGNTEEKAILATAASQGWEVSAFLYQERDIIERRLAHAIQDNEKFILFRNTRAKTSVPRFCVLNPLAIEWLTRYLATRKDKDPRLFPITQDGIQKMLYRLAEQAGLKTTGSLRFHNIRKWLMSRLSRCSFNEFQIKYIMGKSIGVSDSTYLQTLEIEIEEKYPVVYNDYLNISPIISVKETNLPLDELKTKIDAKDKIVDALVQDVTKKDKELQELRNRMQTLETTKPALEAMLKRVEELEQKLKS